MQCSLNGRHLGTFSGSRLRHYQGSWSHPAARLAEPLNHCLLVGCPPKPSFRGLAWPANPVSAGWQRHQRPPGCPCKFHHCSAQFGLEGAPGTASPTAPVSLPEPSASARARPIRRFPSPHPEKSASRPLPSALPDRGPRQACTHSVPRAQKSG